MVEVNDKDRDLYRTCFKIEFLTKRKLLRIAHRKRINISNINPFTMGDSRGFLKVKKPILNHVRYIPNRRYLLC